MSFDCNANLDKCQKCQNISSSGTCNYSYEILDDDGITRSYIGKVPCNKNSKISIPETDKIVDCPGRMSIPGINGECEYIEPPTNYIYLYIGIPLIIIIIILFFVFRKKI